MLCSTPKLSQADGPRVVRGLGYILALLFFVSGYGQAQTIISLNVNPSTITGGATAVGTVNLSGVAPSGGAAVGLKSSNLGVLSVPSMVTVPAGASSMTFTVTTASPAATSSVTISASYAGSNQSSAVTVQPGPALNQIPQNGLTLLSFDSQETLCENGAAVNALDGLTSTIWHTQYCPTSAPLPHQISINLGATYSINGFRYLPRQDGGINGTIGQYAFYVSADGKTWGTAVAQGSFADDTLQRTVLFSAVNAQYVQLQATREVNGGPWTSAAEIDVLGTLATGGTGLSSVSVNPASITGGATAVGTVNLSGVAPSGGAAVGLKSSNLGVVSVPSMVTVPAGASSMTFTVTTTSPAATSSVTLSASYAGSNQSTAVTVQPGPALNQIPQSTISVNDVDSQEAECSNNVATNAIDGNNATFWHTQYCPTAPPTPHEIQINLGAIYSVNALSYLPRQDGGINGTIGQYEVDVSSDGFVWSAAMATGNFAADTLRKTVIFSIVTAQYVRLRALAEVHGGPWTSAAEINVFGGGGTQPPQPPSGSIDSPSSDQTVPVGSIITFQGNGTDPKNLSLTYNWNFGTGSGIASSTAQNPGTEQFNNPGSFVVTFTVTNSNGVADLSPPHVIINVVNAVATATVSQKSWSLVSVDSQDPCCAATNSYDGNPSTFWETLAGSNPTPYPHEIRINLGGSFPITGFSYLPRQDGSTDGFFGQWRFYLSNDGTHWRQPVLSGRFARDATQKLASFAGTTAQYVRFHVVEEASNGNPWASMAELGISQFSCATTPSVRIAQPQDYLLQTSTTLNVSAMACLGAQQTGWGVRFILDGGAGNGGAQFDVHTAPYQGAFANVARGEHIVTAELIDGNSNPVVGTATIDTVTRVGVGDLYVAMGDSITYGTGSDFYPADDISLDDRNYGGGYEPILNNLLTTAKGYANSVIDEGVGGTTSSDGAASVGNLLAQYPNATMFLVQYGTNDAPSRASGLGLNPGDSGYAGSFKDYMQQIITAINNAGINVALAKPPIALADCGNCAPYPDPYTATKNQVLQQYDEVIDELVKANNITITPPDFYYYFALHSQTLYWDELHPNGLGYQAMAHIWTQALTH